MSVTTQDAFGSGFAGAGARIASFLTGAASWLGLMMYQASSTVVAL